MLAANILLNPAQSSPMDSDLRPSPLLKSAYYFVAQEHGAT